MIASIILFLHLSDFITVESAVTSLYIVGLLLLIAEIGVASMGLITLNALLAIYAAYSLQFGDGNIFGVTIGWPVLFGVAFVEIMIIGSIIFIYLWLKNKKATVGTESMIGEKAVIIEWIGKKGTVRYEGEIWKAFSDKEIEIEEGSTVKIESIHKLDIKITI